jgi:hypothetical protein
MSVKIAKARLATVKGFQCATYRPIEKAGWMTAAEVDISQHSQVFLSMRARLFTANAASAKRIVIRNDTDEMMRWMSGFRP